MESQDAMIDIAEWRFDKAEWRYNMVLKGCTKWDEEHPGYKTWNVQHIQLKMLLTDVENRWNEAQEEARSTESTTWANRTATSKAVKNATSLRRHAFDALHEWKTGHSNLNARYPERRELIASERSRQEIDGSSGAIQKNHFKQHLANKGASVGASSRAWCKIPDELHPCTNSDASMGGRA
ncbi:hypothetical protein AeNC1_015689 [Aphanomyces euteiches]|nr:hypothetical protein AeNC1_015689 [Aphanomyces euteiches]